MSALFTFEQIKKDLANTYIPLVCIIVIMLLTTSCNTVPTKQTTSTNTAANSLTTTENIEKELECRYIEITGTRFKKKICKTKETWTEISKKDRRGADELVRRINEQSATSTSQGADSAGGRVNNPTTPGF